MKRTGGGEERIGKEEGWEKDGAEEGLGKGRGRAPWMLGGINLRCP